MKTGAAVIFFTTLGIVLGDTPTYYSGSNATGQLVLARSVNATQAASGVQSSSTAKAAQMALRLRSAALAALARDAESPKAAPKHAPPVFSTNTLKAILGLEIDSPSTEAGGAMDVLSPRAMQSRAASTSSLTIVAGGASVSFEGVDQHDQRLANNGNQFTVEPPNPSIAVSKTYVLEGVNNAIQVYDLTGKPLLPAVLSTNQLFGVSPAIDRTTGIDGVFPTDMRVFYDAGIDRWFVLQRAQDYSTAGDLLSTSHYYLAVSRTGDPTGTYNIYTMDTTNTSYLGCPCVADYPQIGADQYGVYISANQYQSLYEPYVAASILAISKNDLQSGVAQPGLFRFNIPFTNGDEFTIQPAVTPPGGSYVLSYGGAEFFVSTRTTSGNAVALWALTNTSSFITTPSMLLTKVIIPTENYGQAPVATQPAGYRPYGNSLTPPGQLPYIESGDTRALSVVYVGGRLYIAIATGVTDNAGQSYAGAAYIVLSPAIRNSAASSATVSASVVQQGYVAVPGNHLLFPSMTVNAQGRGVIAATLTGPDWFPSSVFIPFSTFSTPSILNIAATGLLPEDGFTGYQGHPARWGDYSAAVVSPDNTLWVASEYIGNLPRTTSANWQTFIAQIKP